MRLLVLSERYPPYHTGGDETACYSVVEGLRRNGHSVVVLTSQHGVDRPTIDGHVRRVLHRPWEMASLSAQGWAELRDHRTLRAIHREVRPEAILCWSVFSLFPSLHRDRKSTR